MPDGCIVFISYSHHDTDWRDRIKDHLTALSFDGRVDTWSDERIATGSDWRTEIQAALSAADAAILLVTRHFLSSPFIRQEEISALLRRRHEDGLKIYAVIAEPCLWNKFRWLEAMQVVRIADVDKKQPTEYEIDQSLVKLVSEIDDALALSLKAEASTKKSPPIKGDKTLSHDEKLSPVERRRRIESLLEQAPGESVDGLPDGLLGLIQDQSQLSILEQKLDPATPPLVLKNAINTLGLLADWEWDHREIKSPETTLPRLTTLYAQVSDTSMRKSILYAISKFSGPEIPFEFLVDRLAVDPPVLKARILAEMQFYVDRPYLAEVVSDRLLPMLHEFCTLPQNKCIYSDEWEPEMDFRFWVFRCLGVIGRPESTGVIEDFIAHNKWPLAALAEAANAHWDITRKPTYVAVLQQAKKAGVAGNTEHALKEIEKYLGVTSRRAAKKAGGGTSATKKDSKRRGKKKPGKPSRSTSSKSHVH